MKVLTSSVNVDKAGRIVLPKKIRDLFNWTQGSSLEITIRDHSLLLSTAEASTPLKQKDKLWIHQGKPTQDILKAVEQQRIKRMRHVAGL
ncbi:MAG: AbrB/MazE/SpoVT family DNA-binding domain-containing protein [Verrucomicrobiota bacterium]